MRLLFIGGILAFFGGIVWLMFESQPTPQEVAARAKEQAAQRVAEQQRLAAWRQAHENDPPDPAAPSSSLLDTCYQNAYQRYSDSWASECRDYGIDYTGPNCKLPMGHAENLEQWHRQARTECVARYSKN